MSNDFYIAPRRKTRQIAIDLDGTLAWPTWEPGQRRSVVGDPIPANVEKLYDLVAQGYDPFVYTSRHWSDYEMVMGWLEHYQLPITRVVCGKPLADCYVDDRAINARAESWLPE